MDTAELRGEVALVTGATRGIGQAIALALARRGCKRRRHGDHRRRARKAIAAILRRRPPGVGTGFQLDVTDAAATESRAGRSRVAARPARRSWSTTPASRATTCSLRMKDEEWDAIMATNLKPVVPPRQGGAARHDEGAPGPHRPDHVGRGQLRQPRPDQLRRRQGRPGRIHQVAGARGGEPQYHRQSAWRPGFIDTDHDAGAAPATSAMRCFRAYRWAGWGRAEDIAEAVSVPGQPAGGLHHRRHAARERRACSCMSTSAMAGSLR